MQCPKTDQRSLTPRCDLVNREVVGATRRTATFTSQHVDGDILLCHIRNGPLPGNIHPSNRQPVLFPTCCSIPVRFESYIICRRLCCRSLPRAPLFLISSSSSHNHNWTTSLLYAGHTYCIYKYVIIYRSPHATRELPFKLIHTRQNISSPIRNRSPKQDQDQDLDRYTEKTRALDMDPAAFASSIIQRVGRGIITRFIRF